MRTGVTGVYAEVVTVAVAGTTGMSATTMRIPGTKKRSRRTILCFGRESGDLLVGVDGSLNKFIDTPLSHELPA